jgi:transposase InsO family protein
VLPPKSPKLNASVERAQGTHTEEFYEVKDCPWTVAELNGMPRRWEHTYNCIRPRQSLGQKTPFRFLKDSGIIPVKNPSVSSHTY